MNKSSSRIPAPVVGPVGLGSTRFEQVRNGLQAGLDQMGGYLAAYDLVSGDAIDYRGSGACGIPLAASEDGSSFASTQNRVRVSRDHGLIDLFYQLSMRGIDDGTDRLDEVVCEQDAR